MVKYWTKARLSAENESYIGLKISSSNSSQQPYATTSERLLGPALNLVTVRQPSCGKVIFSVSVCLSVPM